MKKKAMYEGVMEIIKQRPEFQDVQQILDYWLMPGSGTDYLPDMEISELYAVATPCGSEGIYIDLYAEAKDKRMRIMTLKSLEEGPEAFGSMGRIAGIITWAAYQVWNLLSDQ